MTAVLPALHVIKSGNTLINLHLRLLCVLSSVACRHKTWPPQTLWAGAGGLARPVVDASSGGGQTSCFQFQFQPGEREPIPVFPKPAAFVAVQEVEDGRAAPADAASDCSICLERCGAGGGLTQLRCGHVFHSACLQRWLRSRADCPYCRATVRARS